MKTKRIIWCIPILCSFLGFTQKQIPTNKVLTNQELQNYLKPSISVNGVSEAALASYFRAVFSKRFFHDWQNVETRFKEYEVLYKTKQKHTERAQDHMQKYKAATPWQLPFNYLNGEAVNAYALRHLARQHKMIDVAFMYFYNNKNPKYIDYFTEQLASLNTAFHNNKVETMDSGNGVYEAFRAGYRVLNWLEIHSLFLGQPAYSDQEQLQTIAILLQHGANLYENNAEFKSGNHQTRGVSALAMLAIIFRDFEGTDLWFERAMKRLSEHLDNEINADGFQFERSVHYHMSDIGNYFYVYQLAKISGIKINAVWEQKLKDLFITLTKIAYPTKTAPVLQDDTDIPWAEYNDISGAMTLGYVLFENPEFGYFAKDKVSKKMYWFLKQDQLEQLKNIKSKPPTVGSLAFEKTGYYIMREGWEKNDKMLIISAGVDDKKPDHQHGDILGIQAIANNQVILPNYQVRYSLKDFDFFKNSMVKNVALVDDELQGKQLKSNKGGSGFVKFKELPEPKVITWKSNSNFDLFVGSHNGFENIGVNYSRQVIYIKDDFWIVKDNFASAEAHTYKQVWQGHYTTEEAPQLLRATFDDASGCDIYQLKNVESVKTDGKRGKQWSVVNAEEVDDFEFITVIFPYKGYANRIDETKETPNLKGWEQNKLPFRIEDENYVSLSKENQHYVFGISELKFDKSSITFSKEVDVFVSSAENKTQIFLLSDVTVKVSTKKMKHITKEGQTVANSFELKPGEGVEVKL